MKFSNPFKKKKETFFGRLGTILGSGILGLVEMSVFFGTVYLSLFSIRKLLGR